MRKIKLALFDLDHTLLPVDSCGLWAYFLISKSGENREAFARRQKAFDDDYFCGKLDINEFMDFQMYLMKSFKRSELEAIREEYMKRFILPHICEDALNVVRSYKEQGVETAIVTATHRFPVEPIAEIFGVDRLIASQGEVDVNGEFTGGWLYHTFKEGKVVAVKELLKEKGLTEEDLSEVAFYSDSINDLPLLSLVSEHKGEAVAVNPDPQLLEIAKQKGWKIMQLAEETVKPQMSAVESICD